MRRLRILLIRHGQVSGNKERRFIGITDEGLTAEGRQVIEAREYERADRVFVSPLLRCRQTAEIIYPELEQTIIDELKEMNFGSFEGKNHAELDGSPEYQKWLDEGGRMPTPGGESVDEFSNRVMRGFEAIILYMQETEFDEEYVPTAAIVAHGGTIMAIQSRLGICDFYSRMFENGDYKLLEFEIDEKGYRYVR